VLELRRAVLPGPLLEQLDEIAQHVVNGAKTVKVPAFDYAQVG
jgi:hypothetical protein